MSLPRSWTFVTVLLSVLSLLPVSVVADVPRIDYARMGVVAFAGSFSGLDLYTANATNTFDESTTTLIARHSNGSVVTLGSTERGGSIYSACALDNHLYVAGNFSSLAGNSFANIVAYDTSAKSFSALGSGLDGTVRTLACDASSKNVWVGGDFNAPSGADASKYGGSVAVWNAKSSSWSPPGFFGLSNSVRAIAPNPSGSTLYFGGSFATNYGSNGTQTGNGTNNPNVPFSSGATPFSSSLVPIPLSPADVDANPTTTQQGFNEIANILCPSGPDGPGNTWFSTSNDQVQITLRTNKFNNARGLRLGNTFLENHGTKTFRVTSIPDNRVLTLTYKNPSSGANETCSNNCPLLQDSSVPYQDFLFAGSEQLTGVQLTILESDGNAAGLHLLQLLSDGAFASAITNNNGRSCYSPNASAAYRSGNWRTVNAPTSIAGTVQSVLESTVKVGTSPSSAPQVTWYPYVSASGVYNVYVSTPGCTEFQDCSKRTSVDITVSPGGGASPVTKAVSQRNTDDERTLVYSGYIVPSPPAFTVEVKLALASQPEGSGSGGEYVLIADRVQLELVSLGTSGGAGGAGSGPWSMVNGAMGFGVFEFPVSNSGSGVNATSIINNSSQTTYEKASVAFASAIGSSANSMVEAIAASDDTLYVGGSFSSGNSSDTFSNIVAFLTSGGISALPNGGLNGTVSSLVYGNKTLFVGGSFGGVSSGSVEGLQYIAAYDIGSNSWKPLGGGLNGIVRSIELVGGGSQLLVTGNFSETYETIGSYASVTGGIATFDIPTGRWVSGSGLIVGEATFGIGAGASPTGETQYIAGNIARVSGTSAPNFAILQNGQDGRPSFVGVSAPLTDAASLAEYEAALKNGSSTHKRRRIKSGRRMEPSGNEGLISWLLPRLSAVLPRQSAPSNTPTALPADPIYGSPSVRAVTFWTNQSTSTEAVVLGGNFSFIPAGTSTPASGVALYDRNSKSLAALKGPQINGSVETLYVKDHSLYVGGNFTVGPFSGLAVYDVNALEWQTNVGTVQGDNIVIRSISSPAVDNTKVIIAGSFSQAGNTTCNAICQYDTSRGQWSALGSGLQGNVAAVAYAKSGKEDVLVAAGSMSLSDGTAANVAYYYFGNSSWAPVGAGFPGPVTALGTDDENPNKIFASGRTFDGNAPFVVYWDGQKWSVVKQDFSQDSTITQIQVVPLQDRHPENDFVEPDRMVMVTGQITSSTYGSISAILFDGSTWYPYLSSTNANGSPGIASGMFRSFSSFSFNQRHFLAMGVVILISIAIAAGIVFLLLLIGVLWTLGSRDAPAETKHYEEEEEEGQYTRPSSMLENINAATRTTIIGGGAVAATAAIAKGRESDEGTGPSDVEHDGSGWQRTETPAEAAGAGLVGTGQEADEEVGRPAFARYSFDGEGEGELPLDAGAQVAVLDDRDAAWWYVRDEQTGREGIVPAAYLY